MLPAQRNKVDISVSASSPSIPTIPRDLWFPSLTSPAIETDGRGAEALPSVRQAAHAQEYLDEDAEGMYTNHS